MERYVIVASFILWFMCQKRRYTFCAANGNTQISIDMLWTASYRTNDFETSNDVTIPSEYIIQLLTNILFIVFDQYKFKINLACNLMCNALKHMDMKTLRNTNTWS